MGKRDEVVLRCVSLGWSSVEVEKWTWTTREPESGWLKVMSVSKQAASRSWLVVTPVESKFVAFLWVAPVSALHLKPGFHCLNEVKIGIQLYVKLCVMKPRQLHFYLLEVCPVPKEVLVQVPRLEIVFHIFVSVWLLHFSACHNSI